MVAEPVVVEFHEEHRAPVVEHMVEIATQRKGWMNLSPGLDVDEPPPQRSALMDLVGARGPDVPLATWTPAAKRDPSTVGIRHAQGVKTADKLAELGLAAPQAWRKLQDHPKRGLVFAVPPATDAAELDAVLDWLLRAAGALCPIPRTGEWRALLYG